MTRDELVTVAVELFGEGWQSPLAAATGINARSIRRMVAGVQPVPPRLSDALVAAQRVLDLIDDLAEEYGDADQIDMRGDDGQLIEWTKALVSASIRRGEGLQ
jgi:hypothetical protein